MNGNRHEQFYSRTNQLRSIGWSKFITLRSCSIQGSIQGQFNWILVFINPLFIDDNTAARGRIVTIHVPKIAYIIHRFVCRPYDVLTEITSIRNRPNDINRCTVIIWMIVCLDTFDSIRRHCCSIGVVDRCCSDNLNIIEVAVEP